MLSLSIIVPVYNVGAYLRKCVESLIKQDYENYEIILVDDGSTDESPQICDEFVSIDNRWIDDRYTIRVIHQKNGGLSAARNVGLKIAKGEYVCFVDSDDYWEENVLGRLMAQIKRDKLDVLRFKYQNVRLVESRYEVFNPHKKSPYQNNDYSAEVTDGETFLNTRFGTACYAVMFIVRRTMLMYDRCMDNRWTSIEDRRLKNEDCLFKEGIYFEDMDWTPRMLCRAKRVASADVIAYNYFIREGGITQVIGKKDRIRKNVENFMLIIDHYNDYRNQYQNCRWLHEMQSNMASAVLTTVALEFFNERKEYITRLQGLNVFPFSMANHGKTYRRRAMITNILGADMYCRLMHLMKGEKQHSYEKIE